jgi:hypothetical protein
MSALSQKQTSQAYSITSSARRFMARGDLDRLLDSRFLNGSPWTSETSIGPPGVASSKTPMQAAQCTTPAYQGWSGACNE